MGPLHCGPLHCGLRIADSQRVRLQVGGPFCGPSPPGTRQRVSDWGTVRAAFAEGHAQDQEGSPVTLIRNPKSAIRNGGILN